MSSHPILADLEAARSAIARAAHAFETGDGFDLREIERRVDLAAAAATDLEPAERNEELRTTLLNLVADLDALHRRIASERRKTEDQLGRTAINRRAFVAYGDRMAG